MTGATDSTLARLADVVIDVGISREACPLDLAPTASTTAQLAMGDALAMAVMNRRGFTAEEFASRHPGGSLGRRIVRVDSLMHQPGEIPVVAPDAPLRKVVEKISEGGFGTALVVRADGALAGVITDGDLRRLLQRQERPMDSRAEEVMTREPTTIGPGELAATALRIMEERKITSLPVLRADGTVAGFLHLHQLWKTQLF
jgi:arabinose-5-phosphate isomerase